MTSTKSSLLKKRVHLLPNKSKFLLVGATFIVSVIYALYFFACSDTYFSLAFCVIVIFIDLALYILIDFLYNLHKLSLNAAFIIVLSFLGVLFCLVFPPCSVPDEPYHFIASYKYSDLFLLQPFTDVGLTMRLDDIAFLETAQAEAAIVNAADYKNIVSSGLFAQDVALDFFENGRTIAFDTNLPQLKFTSGLGITIGRLFGLSSVLVFYLGRLCNFAQFIVLAYFAVRVIPFGKDILRIIALLPMTLHLAASYSYDAGIIGMALLLFAFCLKGICETGSIKRSTCIAIIVLTLLLAPCKIVYFVISLIAFLIPSSRFSCKRNSLLFKLGVLGIGLLAVALSKTAVLMSMFAPSQAGEVDAREGMEGHYYTLSGLLSNPLQFFIILIRTTFVMGDFYLITTIGGSLSWFQGGIDAPKYLVFAFLIILLASALPSARDSKVLPAPNRIMLAFLAAISWLGVLLSMLFGWTFDTSPVIEGVQGRYFLPLLPLALFAIRSKAFICTRNISWALIFAMLMLNSIYMMQVFSTAITL